MIYRITIALLFLILSPFSLAEITVHIDRDPVVADESFKLIFETDEDINAEPDFSALNKSFTVLNSSRRSNTQIINGKVSQSQQWILTVIANKTGILGIPSIRFGKKVSKPRSIKVVGSAPATRGNNSEDVFIDVEVNNESPYVQAQIIYTAKLFRAVVTNNASLSEPEVSGGQAVVNKLGEDKSYETQRNGKRYVVIERQYVIFPQSSGALKIEPIIFQGQTGGGNFFNFDPFGPQAQSIVKRSAAIELNVKPIPDSFIGKTWLPANDLKVQEQWSSDPGKLQQGEAATRTLILKADGLAASHLPLINSNIPDKLKQYPDQPEFEETNNANGYIGYRRDKMAIIPTENGEYRLPELKIPWWNTATDKMEFAELPERIIRVEGSTVAKTTDNTIAPIVDSDIRQDLEEGISDVSGNARISNIESSYWKWVSFVLTLLWLITLFIWWRSSTKNKLKTTEVSERKVSSNVYLKQFKQACKINDAQSAKDTLLQWAKSNWPKADISSIAALKEYANTELQQRLDELNNCLYGKGIEQWDGSALLSSFESQSFKQEQKTASVGKLEPLYKT